MMAEESGIDWADAFQNGDYIPQAETYPPRWAARAQAFRATAQGALDQPYGPGARERFDLFLPQGTPRGLVVFLHGGYWLRFDKSSWSDLAAGPLARGWAVGLPSYSLAPQATLPQITAQIGAALAAMAARVTGPLRLGGHSAGGHLATRMVCADTPLPGPVAARIERVVSISGLHDLRPLLLHPMNAQLGLSPEMAARESAICHAPRPGTRALAWVGARERPEFLRQSALLAEHWGRQGAETDLVADPGRHHFDVIDGLKDPDHPLTLALA